MTHSTKYMRELDALLRQTEARRNSRLPVPSEPHSEVDDDPNVHDGWASVRPRQQFPEAA